MDHTVRFYFSVRSPYAWLAAEPSWGNDRMHPLKSALRDGQRAHAGAVSV